MKFALPLLLLTAAVAQSPDSHGEQSTTTPAYRGEPASAPIPPEMHTTNEGGSDGAGLCVIASVTANGLYQGVPGLDQAGPDGHPGHGSTLWRTAKARPGGYGPSKLQSLVDEVYPSNAEPYASYVGTDPAILDRLSRQGYPIGATMNTGALYSYQPIHHMISLIHYRTGGWAMVRDNNDRPGIYRLMPAAEYARRWIDGGEGWAWIWLRKVTSPDSGNAALILAAVGLVLVALWRRRQLA